MMITGSLDVPLPELVDDEHLKPYGSGVQPDGTPSKLSLFVASCGLWDVAGSALNQLYSNNMSLQKPSGDSSTVLAILDCDRQMTQFWESLPSHLRQDRELRIDDARIRESLNLQRQIIFCRICLIRLMIFRPALLLAIDRGRGHSDVARSKGFDLEERLERDCCQQCAEVASQLSSAVHSNLGSLRGSTGWHTVHCE